jgi:hypothetical protein
MEYFLRTGLRNRGGELFAKLVQGSWTDLIEHSQVERVLRRRLAVKIGVDEKLAGLGVEPEHGVAVAVGDDEQQVAVEAEVAVVSIDLKKIKITFRNIVLELKESQ